MNFIININFGFALYLASILHIAFTLISANRTESVLHRNLISILAITASAAVLFINLFTLSQSETYGFSLLNSLSLILSTTVLLVGLLSIQSRIHALLIVLSPMALIALAAAQVFEPTKLTHLSAPVAVHVWLSILSHGLLLAAMFSAALLSLLQFRLKHQISMQNSRLMSLLPPVESIDRIFFKMLSVGLALLTLSILSGLLYLENFWQQQLLHKTVFSIASWFIFSILSAGHFVFGWRGKKVVNWAFTGFACLMLGYIGSKLVIEYFLS